MSSINMKRLCADALADYLASQIPGLAGKIASSTSGPETQANCLALRILPESFSFEESEPDEVYFSAQDDGKVVVNIGLFSGIFSLQLYTASPAERELYEQKILDVFLAGPWAPGTLYLNLPNLTVNGYASLYSAEASAYLQSDTWNDELSFESRRMSFVEIAIEYPALTTYDAPIIESLQLDFADIDQLVLTTQDVAATDQVEVQEDGSTTLVPVPIVKIVPADSNGVGQAIAPDEWDSTFDPMTEISAIRYFKHYSQAASDPITFLTDINTGGVRPYNIAGVPNSGFQITLAQEFVRAGFLCALEEMAISGTRALEWNPLSNYPTNPPGGPNIWTQDVTRTTALQTSLPGRVKGSIFCIGGNDGFNSSDANACQANLTAIVNATLAQYGSNSVIVLIRNSNNQGPAVPFLSTIQAAQDAVAALYPNNIIVVWTNDLALHSDNLHFNGNSYAILGQRIAYAFMDKFGLMRFRPTDFPMVVGWGPQFTSTGAYSPVGPGCSIAGDLEVLIAYSMTASGTNSPISQPTTTGTQWILQGSQIVSTALGSTTRLAVFTRAVTQTDLTNNHRNTAPTTVPVSSPTVNAINGGRICVFRGPNLNPTPNAFGLSKNDAFNTSLTLSQIQTTVNKCGVLLIGGGYRFNASPNPVTMSASGPLANLVSLFGSNVAIGSDFITNAAWYGQMDQAGLTGNVQDTFALSTIAAGGMLAIQP